jgi:hypothetical protein
MVDESLGDWRIDTIRRTAQPFEGRLSGMPIYLTSLKKA